MADLVLNLGSDAGKERAFVDRATDPVVTNVSTPGDFAAQFPQPLNTHEIIAMCDEINLWRELPEQRTQLKAETYREMNELAFTSGSSYVSFTDGACPEEYEHDGDNTTVTLKNLGAKKSLTISDIMHSAAVAGMSRGPAGVGIGTMVGGFPSSAGLPGGIDSAPSFGMEGIRDLKEKEMLLASVLTMNGWDRLLALGNATNNALEFDGIELLVSSGTGAHYNLPSGISGSFTAIDFDRFLAEGCAKPTAIFGHATAIQEMMSAYFQLGWQGSQNITLSDGNRVIPGYNFAGEVFTGVGRLRVVADNNFTRTNMGDGTFQSSLFPLRMVHNGEPLVYKATQIPLAFKDLSPGCTAISFQIWAKTALIIKARCAQARYTKSFTGRIVTTCPTIGLTND